MADTYYDSRSRPPSLPPGSDPAHAGPAEVPNSRIPTSEGVPAKANPEADARAGQSEPSASGDYQPPPLEDDSADGTAAKYDPEALPSVSPGSDSGSKSELSSPSASLLSETSGSPPSTIPTSPESETAGGGASEIKDAAIEVVEVMVKGRELDPRARPSPPPPARLVEAVSNAEHIPTSPPPAPASPLPTSLQLKDPGDPANFSDESDEEENTSHLDSFDDVEFAAQYQDEEGIDSPLAKATEVGEIGDAMLDDLGDAEVELGLGSSPTRRRDSLKAQQDVMEVIEEVDEEAVLREEEMAVRRERELGTSAARSARREKRSVEDGDEDGEVEHVERVDNTGNFERADIGDPHCGSDNSFRILRPKQSYRTDALSGSERSFDDEEAHTSRVLCLSPTSSSAPATCDNRGQKFLLQLPVDLEEDDALSQYPGLRGSMAMSTDELQIRRRTNQLPGLPQQDLQTWLTRGYLCGARQEHVSQLPFNPFRSTSASASRKKGGELKPWEYNGGIKRDVQTHLGLVLPDEITAEEQMRGRKGNGDTDPDERESISDDETQVESYGYKLERVSSKPRSRSPVDDITLRARSLCPASTGSSSPPPFGRRSCFPIQQELDQSTPLASPFTEINVIVDNAPSSQPLPTPTPFSSPGQFPFIQNNNPTIIPHRPGSDVDSDSGSSVITVIGPHAPAGAAWMHFYAFLGRRQRALLGNRAKTRSIYYGGLWHGFWLEKKGAFDYFPSEDWEWTEPLRRWRRGGMVEAKRPAIIIRPQTVKPDDGGKVLIGRVGRSKVVVEVEGGEGGDGFEKRREG